MLEALIAGERDPRRLAELARGRMKTKRPALIEAMTGQFDDHHGEIARMLLDQIDSLSVQIEQLTTRAEQLLQTLPAAQPSDQHAGGEDHPPGQHGPPQGTSAEHAVADRGGNGLTAWARLDEIPGIGPLAAQVIIAEIGLDMGRFPTPAHLVSWAKLCPRTIQSGAKHRGGATGKGNPYLKGVLGEAAAAAAKTNTFLGERYRRIVKRRGKLKALVAVARSILVIVWNLLSDPSARFQDLGPDYHTQRVDTTRKIRNHISQLTALGYRVTLEPAA
jgi:transposase